MFCNCFNKSLKIKTTKKYKRLVSSKNITSKRY